MAGWLDYLNRDLQNRRTSGNYGTGYYRSSSLRVLSGGSSGYDPFEVGRSSRINRSIGAASGGGVRSPRPASPAGTPASPPERFDVSLPFSNPVGQVNEPAAPQKSTQGDLIGSAFAALGGLGGSGLNIANVVPYFMERTHALAAELAASNQGNPIGAGAGAAESATGAFLGAIEKMSDVVAPVMDALPNWNRDSTLNDRAKLYRSIVTGQEAPSMMFSGPLASFGQLLSMPISMPGRAIQRGAALVAPGSPIEDFGAFLAHGGPMGELVGNTAAGQKSDYEMYRDLFLHSADPEARMSAQHRIQMLLEQIDLPPSVKAAIHANPDMSDEQLGKLLNEAPEGKQWSYQPGVGAMLQNAGNPLAWYIAEAKGLGAMGGYAGTQATALGAESGISAITSGVAGATRAVTIAAKIQRAAFLSGVGVTALTTGMDTIARYQGNQAAIDWFQRVSAPGEFAENPNVQLVTSFSVNPLEGTGALAKGIIRLAKGGGDIVIGRSLGQKFLKTYTNDEFVYGLLAKMYRLDGPEEARRFAHDSGYYETKGQVFDEVVGLAADTVLDRLPQEERLGFLAAHSDDPVELTRAVLTTYGNQVWDTLENHSDELVQRWTERSWQYHNYPGAFNADVAALNARDFRGAKERTYDFRQQNDAVVGYRDYLPPEGVALAREMLGDRPTIAVEGIGGVQDLVRQFPAMRKYWQGLIEPGATSVPRAKVEAMLDRATADYAQQVKQNPVAVRTGADPVLRPDSPRMEFDYAEALGTDVETVRAVSDYKPGGADAGQVSKLRDFLVEKEGLDPAVVLGMDADQVWSRASDYFDRTTKPWVEAGNRVVAAEKRIESLTAELRRLHATATGRRTSAELERIRQTEVELSQLRTLVRAAGDPIRPFSADVRLEQIRSRNADRVRAMDPDHLTANDDRFLRRYLSDDSRGISVADDVKGRDLWEQAREIADEQPSVTGRDAHLQELADRKVAAQEVLRQMDAIDEMVTAPDGFNLDVTWPTLLRKVEGRWTWSGGKPPMSRPTRDALSRYFASKARGGMAKDIMTMGDEDAWGVLRDHPEALASMTRRTREYVSRTLAAHPDLYSTQLDELADRAVRNGAATSTEDFLEKIVGFANAREELLGAGADGGLRLANMRRTAAMKVSPEYVRAAEANLDTVYYDAEFDAVIHPQNLAELSRIIDAPDELYPALEGLVARDPDIATTVRNIADEAGVDVDTVLRDRAYAPQLRRAIPEGFEPPTPGQVAEETALDQLVMQGDAEAIAQRSQELRLAADGPAEPIQTTRSRAQATFQRTVRPSGQWRRKLIDIGADLSAAPNPAILADPANRIGVDALSVMNHGVVGAPPATIRGTIDLLEEIERGGPTRMGFGASVQAEAQRVARSILEDARNGAKRRGFQPGEFSKGLDPAAMGMEDLELARALKVREASDALKRTLDRATIRAGEEAASQAANIELGVLKGGTAESGGAIKGTPIGPELRQQVPPLFRGIDIRYEPGDPLGTLQYGLKARRKDAVVMELSQVPGLAEEFVTKRFEPWSERVWTSQARRLFNYVFGAHPNEAVHGAIHQQFIERLARQGIDGELADEIWTDWRARADKSRDVEVRVNPDTGVREHLPGDNPLYASVANIPNNQMDAWAHEAVDAVLDARMAKGLLDPRYRTLARSIDYSQVFRESSSNMRRFLLGEPVKIGAVTLQAPVPTSLGKALAGAYGMAAHNKAVTTAYYWFRFGLDIRFHAMNFFESQILYAGRAGLRKGEIDTGMLGQTEGYLRRLDTDFVNNTGYTTSRSRFAWAYRTFLKEQPDALRKSVKGLQTEDPQLMEQAIRELADVDPQLSDMIANTGGTADGWVKALDEWHGKLLRTVDDSGADAVIDDAIAEEIRKTPAMAEVYSSLSQANKDLWRDIRSTFYGNPDRSRAERFLNSYLLFWPLSYQVKASKWLLRVMYDRAGGLPTNAAGAVVLDRLAQSHQQLLATDPPYRDWFEKHPTLVFVAQMLLPVSPTSMGVSLNPALRSMFFGRTKAIWDIGPVYTFRHVIPQVGEEVMTDLYPTLKDVPGIGDAAGGLYRVTTGRNVPGLDEP